MSHGFFRILLIVGKLNLFDCSVISITFEIHNRFLNLLIILTSQFKAIHKNKPSVHLADNNYNNYNSCNNSNYSNNSDNNKITIITLEIL